MFNLLPQKDKNIANKEYRNRRLATLLIFTGVTALVGIFTLTPSHLVAWYKFREVQNTYEVLKNNAALKSNEDLKLAITSTNAKIKALRAAPESKIASVLGDVIERRGSDIKIDQFTIKYNEQQKLIMTVRGVARDRESLMSFGEKLRENKTYEKVDLPVSNFTKESNIEFALTITSV